MLLIHEHGTNANMAPKSKPSATHLKFLAADLFAYYTPQPSDLCIYKNVGSFNQNFVTKTHEKLCLDATLIGQIKIAVR